MERIGLYGGMFDPVHLGHLHAAREAAARAGLDRVLFIPAKIPPHKENGCVAAGEDRLAMLRLAIRDESRFFVSDYELMRDETSYSYITVEHFAKELPAAKLYFILGDEAYNLLHTWKNPERIRELATFLVVTRENTPPPTDAMYVQIPKVQISSTMVREALRMGQSTRDYLPKVVEDYIQSRKLYCM